MSATAPTDRSTSARSRTSVSAIASTMYTVLSPKIYTRLLGRRKACSGVMISKTTATTTMARTTGSTPLLPLRTRSHQIRMYWPSDWARIAGGTSAAATLASRVRSAVPALAVPAGVSPGSAVTGAPRFWPSASALATCGSGWLVRPPAGGTRRHVLHHALQGEVPNRPFGHHPPQVQDRDAVGDLEHVGQVVADHHHRQPAVAESFDQVKHGPGLHHPKGGGGLVEQHQLGVPHHRLGDRHRLPLTSRERGDWLPDRAHCRHPQGAQGLGRLQLHRVLVEQAVAQPLPAEKHVLDDVQVVGQRKILVDGLDPQGGGIPGAPDVHRLPVEEDLAMVRLVGAGDGAGEHRFPGPVVTAQAGHLAGGQVQVHPVERLHRPEVLVDAPQPQQGVGPVPAAARACRLLVPGGGAPPQYPPRQPRSDDYLIPFAEQTLAPASAQIAEAVSNLSATTVDSMFDLVTHVADSRDAGSVMLVSAESVAVPFSRVGRTFWPASRMVATVTASWTSL